MQEFEKTAMFAMMDQLEAQLNLVTNQLRTIRGLMYHVGAERPQSSGPAAAAARKAPESSEYLGEDDEKEIEKFIEAQRRLGLAEQERVTAEWEAQRKIIESEEYTL